MSASSPTVVLLKFALRAVERGDAEGGAEALRAVIAIHHDQAPTPAKAQVVGPHALKTAKFAALIDATPRHVRNLIASGVLKTIGQGKGKRILVAESMAALSERETSSLEDEGAEYVRRRNALQVVR